MEKSILTQVEAPRFKDIIHWSNPVARNLERLASFHGRTFSVLNYSKSNGNGLVALTSEASRWKYVALALQVTILSPLVIIAALAKWLFLRKCKLVVQVSEAVSVPSEIEKRVQASAEDEMEIIDIDLVERHQELASRKELRERSQSPFSVFIGKARCEVEERQVSLPFNPRTSALELSEVPFSNVVDLNSRFIQRVCFSVGEFPVDMNDALLSQVAVTYLAAASRFRIQASTNGQETLLFSLHGSTLDRFFSTGHTVVQGWNADTIFPQATTDMPFDVGLDFDALLQLREKSEKPLEADTMRSGEPVVLNASSFVDASRTLQVATEMQTAHGSDQSEVPATPKRISFVVSEANSEFEALLQPSENSEEPLEADTMPSGEAVASNASSFVDASRELPVTTEMQTADGSDQSEVPAIRKRISLAAIAQLAMRLREIEEDKAEKPKLGNEGSPANEARQVTSFSRRGFRGGKRSDRVRLQAAVTRVGFLSRAGAAGIASTAATSPASSIDKHSVNVE